MSRTLLALAGAVAWSGLVFYTGYAAGSAQCNAKWRSAEAQYASQAKQALQAAQARGDALTAGLLVQQGQIDQLKTEKQHAITRATTGRTCLGADALRVLDQSPGITFAGPAPATGGAAAAGGTLGTDTGVATDTDIALWIVTAGASFEVCRARLDALIDWHVGEQGK